MLDDLPFVVCLAQPIRGGFELAQGYDFGRLSPLAAGTPPKRLLSSRVRPRGRLTVNIVVVPVAGLP